MSCLVPLLTRLGLRRWQPIGVVDPVGGPAKVVSVRGGLTPPSGGGLQEDGASIAGITFADAPKTVSATGTAGTLLYDSSNPNYLYVAVDTDTWKRIILLDW